MGVNETIEQIKMDHDAVQRKLAGDKQTENTKTFAEKEKLGSFHAVSICTEHVCYGVDFSYLRPVQFLRQEQAIFCMGDGYKFAIEGDNMELLFTLLKARAIARIVHGEKIEIGQTVINVESVTAEPLEGEK